MEPKCSKEIIELQKKFEAEREKEKERERLTEIIKEREIEKERDQIIYKMVKDIGKLGKSYHKDIYRILRNTRPYSYFASNNVCTKFNIYKLNDSELCVLREFLDISLAKNEVEKDYKEFILNQKHETESLTQNLTEN